MNQTLMRDVELTNGFLALENQMNGPNRGLGGNPEAPSAILARSIYKSIRKEA